MGTMTGFLVDHVVCSWLILIIDKPIHSQAQVVKPGRMFIHGYYSNDLHVLARFMFCSKARLLEIS